VSEDRRDYLVDMTMTVNRSFTCSIRHAAMVNEMIERGVAKDFSKVVRRAIETLYAQELPFVVMVDDEQESAQG
jgi:hypothetical protein